MRSRTPKDLKGFCPTCFFRHQWCLCSKIVPMDTRAHFILVRHYKEAFKTSNSGRIASLALSNSSLYDYGVKGAPFDPSVLDKEGTRVLFPAVGGEKKTKREELREVKNVIILDGTWSQARRMYQRIEILRNIPKLSLEPHHIPPIRIRQAPTSSTMATIEAIARAIEILGEPEKANYLDNLFAAMYQHFQAQRLCVWPIKNPIL